MGRTYRPRGKFDTPTDAVSRRAFDRVTDRLKDDIKNLKSQVRELQKTVKAWRAWGAPPPPRK